MFLGLDIVLEFWLQYVFCINVNVDPFLYRQELKSTVVAIYLLYLSHSYFSIWKLFTGSILTLAGRKSINQNNF